MHPGRAARHGAHHTAGKLPHSEQESDVPAVDELATRWYKVVVVRITTYRSYQKGVIALENLTEMLKGVLEGCVLEIISRGETYGYEIASSLRTLGFADVVEGTVYTILLRLEKNGLVNIEKRPSTMGPPRKFYSLNQAGRAELATFWAKWDFVSFKMNELKESAHG
jgi:DNA-binding PadR family transcriptional regulator